MPVPFLALCLAGSGVARFGDLVAVFAPVQPKHKERPLLGSARRCSSLVRSFLGTALGFQHREDAGVAEEGV